MLPDDYKDIDNLITFKNKIKNGSRKIVLVDSLKFTLKLQVLFENKREAGNIE